MFVKTILSLRSFQDNKNYQNKMENNLQKKPVFEILLLVVLFFVLAGSIYFGVNYFSMKNRLDEMVKNNMLVSKINYFEQTFVDRVLSTKGEISYEDRLKLENAVVDTKDEKVIKAWKTFLDSKTEPEAQQAVLDLLKLFAKSRVIK